MVFSSLFFVGVFLPLFILLYYLCPTVGQKNICLLLFSLVFYAFGGMYFLFLAVIVTFAIHVLAKKIENSENDLERKKFLASGIFISAINLILFKALGVMEAGSIALPIGISFYTFKLISYIVDVYRDDVDSFEKFHHTLLYAISFHHVLQGPIIRADQMRYDMTDREATAEMRAEGMWRFCIGLGKKILLADPLGEVANTLLPIGGGELATVGIWLGTLAFGLQLYLDFSGYSDMAIGLGRICGFTYEENFNYPYIAGSIKDFWRRWHMSLSGFFRDYVYIPLGGSRGNKIKTLFNLLVVWALTGIWHGTGLNFLLWGLYYFLLLSIERVIKPYEKAYIKYACYPLTFILVFFGWLLFRMTDTEGLLFAIRGFFGVGSEFYIRNVGIVFKNNIFLIVLGFFASTPLFKLCGEVMEENINGINILKALFVVVVLALSVLVMTGNSFTPFLYEKF